MVTIKTFGIALSAALFASVGTPRAEADRSVEIMARAARTLSFSVPENRAFMLEKNEIPVGVIFGYADNRAACRQIAEILSTHGHAGAFKCNAIW